MFNILYLSLNKNNYMSEIIAKQLKALRLKTGVSQREVAEEIGNIRVNYMNWENSYANPSYSDICKLADYFGVTTDFILNHKTVKK